MVDEDSAPLIAVARETLPGEARVALVPDLVAKVITLGYAVAIEPGAGRAAMHTDEEYAAAGAEVAEGVLDRADVVISVQPLTDDQLHRLRPGTTTLSFFSAPQSPAEVEQRRGLELTTFAMEFVPRISRAQSMDALSSQSLVSGYRCAVVAASRLRKFFPLNMTAAGTVPPAEVVVLGAGVAGLQAIATAKRLGAVVRGYDVRAAAAEEIRSVGAHAIELDLETLDGAGGYAREMTEDRAARQRELLTPWIAAADALITTAAVPGRQAPLLVTRAMVEQMKVGSVVVDLAADSGGNVEGAVPGEVVQVGGAQLWGGSNVPSQMPGPASRLYAQNVISVLDLLTTDGRITPDFDDEIVTGMCITHAGQVPHAPTRAALKLDDQVEEPTQEPTGGTSEIPTDPPADPSEEESP